MSDTDEGNAGGDDATEDDGGFDKEAERERLREKYERDKQRRETTQRMSELLLKGATMTNQHCESCGSPLFRHDGEVFCPTCQGTREVVDEGTGSNADGADAGGADAGGADAGAADADGADADGADAGEAPDANEVTTSDDGFDFGGHDRDERRPAERDERRRTPDLGAAAGSGRSERNDVGGRSERSGRSSTSPPGDDGSPNREPLLDSSRGPSAHGSGVEEAPSLSQAKASLRRAIVSLSEQAAQSDDPGRAHALLEGTREAAEALAALGGDKE